MNALEKFLDRLINIVLPLAVLVWLMGILIAMAGALGFVIWRALS